MSSSLLLTSCSNDPNNPDAIKLFKKVIEENAQRDAELRARINGETHIDIIGVNDPFDGLEYLKSPDNDDSWRDVSTYWPVEAATNITKRMKQQTCSKEVSEYGVRFKCFVTVDDTSSAMPALKDVPDKRMLYSFGYDPQTSVDGKIPLKGVIRLKQEADKIEFIDFRRG